MKPGGSDTADTAARRLLLLLGTVALSVTMLAAAALGTLGLLYRSELVDHCSRLRDWLAGHPEVLLGSIPLGLMAYVVGFTIWRATEQGMATSRLLAKLDKPRPMPERLARVLHPLGIAGRVDFVAHPVPLCFCYGLGRPRVCASAGLVDLLDDAELAAVLRHERHHLARRDPARLFVAQALRSGIGFLPGVTTVVDRYAVATEIAADAASAANDEERLLLAQAVLKVLRAQHGLHDLPAAVASAFSPVAARVDSLLTPDASFPRLQARTMVHLTAGIGMLAVLTAAPIALAARPDSQQAHPCATDFRRHLGGGQPMHTMPLRDRSIAASDIRPDRPPATRQPNRVRRRSCALTATTTVLSDIKSAPKAGESRMPQGARIPAAKGRAMTL